jgi:hypothetical protein
MSRSDKHDETECKDGCCTFTEHGGTRGNWPDPDKEKEKSGCCPIDPSDE